MKVVIQAELDEYALLEEFESITDEDASNYSIEDILIQLLNSQFWDRMQSRILETKSVVKIQEGD